MASTVVPASCITTTPLVYHVFIHSKWRFCLVFCMILVAQAVIAGSYAFDCFKLVQIIQNWRSDEFVRLLGVGRSIRPDVVWASIVSSALFSLWHTMMVLKSLLASIVGRKLRFRFEKPPEPKRKTSSVGKLMPLKWYSRCWMRLKAVWRLVGVQSPHFDTVLELRELMELISQTYQVHQLSLAFSSDVGHEPLLHAGAWVLIGNCWSTPLIRLVLRLEGSKRLWCLVIDILFDYCSTFGLPMLTYWLWEDLVLTADWYDIEWLVQASNALEYLLVNTWMSFLATRLPAIGLILAMETIKSLIRRPPLTDGPTASARLNAVKSASKLQFTRLSRTHKLIDGFFLVYGTCILVLYAQAAMETIPGTYATGCSVQMRPWARSINDASISCAAYQIDCWRHNLTGTEAEIDQILAQLDPDVLGALVISHCSSLTIPPRIQTFGNLLYLELYNASLASWTADAALTSRVHRRFSILFLIRVFNMSELPDGLLDDDFPTTLTDLEICESDLAALPDSLVTKWPNGTSVISIENSALTSFPLVLTHKNVAMTLSLSGNAIESLPIEAIMNTTYAELRLSQNPIYEVPLDVDNMTSTNHLISWRLDNTWLYELPLWMQQDAYLNHTVVTLTGTRICEDVMMMLWEDLFADTVDLQHAARKLSHDWSWSWDASSSAGSLSWSDGDNTDATDEEDNVASTTWMTRIFCDDWMDEGLFFPLTAHTFRRDSFWFTGVGEQDEEASEQSGSA